MRKGSNRGQFKAVVVWVTFPSRTGAQQMAKALLERKWVSSAQISGPIISQYWWKKRLYRRKEWVCSLRTTQSKLRRIIQFVREAHEYEVPEIFALPITSSYPAYLKWVKENSTGGS